MGPFASGSRDSSGSEELGFVDSGSKTARAFASSAEPVVIFNG